MRHELEDMPVLSRTNGDPWAVISMSVEADLETTPLNSPEKHTCGTREHLSSTSTVPPNKVVHADLAAQVANSFGTHKADVRRSRNSYALLFLLLTVPILDTLVLFDLFINLSKMKGEVAFGEDTRAVAQVLQICVVIFTLAFSAYSVAVHRRWMVSLPRHAAAVATSFALLPEFTTIALVVDLGKLAYPVGSRTSIIALMMLARVGTIAMLLRLAYIAGLRRGIVSDVQMPEMLRTLVSLDGVEARGLGEIAPQSQSPLTIELLDKLIVFLTPLKLGSRAGEGAGLARNSILPLTVFTLCITAIAAFTEYERMRTSQEPSLSASIAQAIAMVSINQTNKIGWRPPSAQPVPPVSTFVVIVSGVNYQVGTKILSKPFDPAINELCALDVQTSCDRHRLRAVSPSTSLPNWIAALTGMSPTSHGVLGNYAIGAFPFDSIFGPAREYGVHAGVSASPWLANTIKVDLPLLGGDGRTTSSADGNYETTRAAITAEADARRRETTLNAVRANAASVDDAKRSAEFPSQYALFVTQLTNVDSIGHRAGTITPEYEDAIRAIAGFLVELMRAMPSNSVLLVLTDHGHEPMGGTGGASDAVSRIPMYSFRKTVSFGASPLELEALARAARRTSDTSSSTSTRSGTTTSASASLSALSAATASVDDGISDAEYSIQDLAPTIALLLGLPLPRHSEGRFIPSMFANARREMWPQHAHDMLIQQYHYCEGLLNFDSADRDGWLRALSDIERDAMAQIGAGGGTLLEQTLAWLQAASEVQAAVHGLLEALAARYAMRNVAVSLAVAVLVVALVMYVLHAMTFADPFHVLSFRRLSQWHKKSVSTVTDAIAISWALGVVGLYYLITSTVYLTYLQGQWRYSAFDASHVHDTFSERRYLITALVPGLLSQWALTRSFTIYYRAPFAPSPPQPSLLLTGLRWLIKIRLIWSAQVQSREVEKVYLIRLYVAAFAIFSSVIIFLASASASFPLPYMYQPKHVDAATWGARFQSLTFKIMSMPLLVGAMYNLYLWRGTKLTVDEVDALYVLKRKKESRLLGISDREVDRALVSQRIMHARKDGSVAVLEDCTANHSSSSANKHTQDWLDDTEARSSSAGLESGSIAQGHAEDDAVLGALLRSRQRGDIRLQELEQLCLRTKVVATPTSSEGAHLCMLLPRVSSGSGSIWSQQACPLLARISLSADECNADT